MKRRLTPTIRITAGLVVMMLSAVVTAHFLGFMPDKKVSTLAARQQVSESLSVYLSMGLTQGNWRSMNALLSSVVERNDDILSVAVRDSKGDIVTSSGDHLALWIPLENDVPTPTHVQVPLFNRDARWGSVEITFTPIEQLNTWQGFRESLAGLLLFISVAGFLAYFFFLRRALRELDPTGLIPERVRAAFDSLAEGVLITDEREFIVLANKSLARQVGQSVDDIIGKRASQLKWQSWNAGESTDSLPWIRAIRDGVEQKSIPLHINSPNGEKRMFSVNAISILDGKDKVRGALITFDDVTEIEQKNVELKQTLEHLEDAQKRVESQNRKLHFLATRDPMTGCLNRREFLKLYEAAYGRARDAGSSLSCIMVDIDLFKGINDRFGHPVGDSVIIFVAENLKSEVGKKGMVCRYGGEEFCIVLPDLDSGDAAAIAEIFRTRIRSRIGAEFTPDIHVTISSGVAALTVNTEGPDRLIDEADQALYEAKNTGRDRVVQSCDIAKRVDDALAETDWNSGDDVSELIESAANRIIA